MCAAVDIHDRLRAEAAEMVVAVASLHHRIHNFGLPHHRHVERLRIVQVPRLPLLRRRALPLAAAQAELVDSYNFFYAVGVTRRAKQSIQVKPVFPIVQDFVVAPSDFARCSEGEGGGRSICNGRKADVARARPQVLLRVAGDRASLLLSGSDRALPLQPAVARIAKTLEISSKGSVNALTFEAKLSIHHVNSIYF
jgi:hypothetical protein